MEASLRFKSQVQKWRNLSTYSATERFPVRAMAIDDFGTAPALHDVPVPEPGPGEVLVRVHASSINGFDRSVVSGGVKDMMEYQFPLILGMDFAGTIEAVGPGASRFAVGDRVFGVALKP